MDTQEGKAHFKEPEYTLYSASWCGNCPAMKLWLTQQGVSFTTKDIDNVASDELDFIGLRSIPALVKDGKTVGVGESIKKYILSGGT